MSELLPREVEERLRDFMVAGKSGRIEIDIRGGSVVGARIVDAIPVLEGVRVER